MKYLKTKIVFTQNNLPVRNFCVRFQVLTAVSLKMTAFWDIAPFSLVEVDRRFRGVYWLHHKGDNGIYQKAVIWFVITK
jgi:hypothetical protein